MSIATSTEPRPGPYGGAVAWAPYLAGTPDSGADMDLAATALGLFEVPATVLVEHVFDALAGRLWPGAATGRLTVDWDFVELGVHHRMQLAGGELMHWPVATAGPGADVVVTVSRAQMHGLVAGAGMDGLPAAGDPGAQRRLAESLTPVRSPRTIDDPVTGPLAERVDPLAGERRRDRTAEPLRVPVGPR
jgi:hypothetical protein